MRFKVLAVVPLVWTLAFVGFDLVLYGSPSYGIFVRTEIELAKALSLAGAWAAAIAHERGDYPRRAWFLIGACLALLLLRDLTLAPIGWEALGTDTLYLLRGSLVAVGNASQVVGTWLLARSWKVASLALPGPQERQWLVVVAAVVLGLAVVGPGVVADTRAVASGDLATIPGLASALGDMISLWLIAPLLLTALALRGGLIGWPFALLTTSYVAWLFYDALAALGPQLGLDPRWVRTGSEVFRALGCTFGFSAGLAQRFVVIQMRGLGRRS